MAIFFKLLLPDILQLYFMFNLLNPLANPAFRRTRLFEVIT